MPTTLAVHEELEQIRQEHGGVLRPTDVVERASDPSTALHERFEWDNDKAGHQHRLAQARALIRFTVKVIGNGAPKKTKAYVSLAESRAEGDSYYSIDDVMADPDRRSSLLEQAMAEAQSWQRRYEYLEELVPVFEALKSVRKKPKRQKGRKRSELVTT